MKRRIFTSTLVLLGALTAAEAASASTNINVTSAAAGRVASSVTKEWTEDSKLGDMGVYFDAGYDISANHNGSAKYEEISGGVGAVLFNQDIPIASSSVRVHAGQSSALKGDYRLTLFGLNLIHLQNVNLDSPARAGLSIQLAKMKVGGVEVSANGNWGIDGADFSVDVSATKDADLTFAGVPIVLSFGAAGEVGIDLSAGATYSSNTGVGTIDLSGEPYAEIDGVASAGVGTGAASAGVYGEVTLLHVGVPIINSLTLTPVDASSGIMSYSTTGHLNVSSLAGNLGVYVSVWPFTYKHSLFKWDGVEWLDQLVFSDSIPVAAGVQTKISGKKATASYTYADRNPESGSTIKWYRAQDSNGTGSTLVQSGANKSYELTEADSGKFFRTCVKPSNGVNTGAQVCSPWSSAGPLMTYYWDANYGGDELSVAYSRSRSGTCFTLGDLESGWDDDASSYKFDAPPGCATTLYMYKFKDCGGSVMTRTFPVGTPGEDIASIASTLGSGWNNEIGSFSVVFCDTVSASDVKVGYSGYKTQGGYTLNSASIFQNDKSTFHWYRASSATGSGKTQISTSSTFTMDPSQAGNFLQFCVTPNNGTSTGAKTCSSWTHVPAVVFYWHANFGGDTLTFPYTQSSSGKCYNMSDVKSGWADDAGSLRLYAPLTKSARLHVYKNKNCSGAEASTLVAAGGSASVAHVGDTYGSGWNNEISSFKVVY